MHPILRTVLQRLGLGLITLLIFSSLEMLPGGFAQQILGQSATPETVTAFNRELGLDRPAVVRYFEWIGLQGDFGTSYAGAGGTVKRYVGELIAPRLYYTTVFAALIAVPLALVMGILAALFRNSWLDRIMNSMTLATVALPEFFVAYVLIFFSAIKLRFNLRAGFPALKMSSKARTLSWQRTLGHGQSNDPMRLFSQCPPVCAPSRRRSFFRTSANLRPQGVASAVSSCERSELT